MSEGKSTGEQYDAHIIAQNQRESENEELAFKAKLHNAISSRDSYKAASLVLDAEQEMLFPNGQDNYFNRVLEVVLLGDRGILLAIAQWPENYLKSNNNEVMNMLINKIKKFENESTRQQGAYTIIEKGYFFDDDELFQECVDIVEQSFEYSHEAVKNWDKKYLTGKNDDVFFRLVESIEKSNAYSYNAINEWPTVYLERKINNENKRAFDKFVDAVATSPLSSFLAISYWDKKYLTGKNDWVFDKLFKIVLESTLYSYLAVNAWNMMYLPPNIVELLVDSVVKDSEHSFSAVSEWPEKYLTPQVVVVFLEKILAGNDISYSFRIIKKWPTKYFTGDYQFIFDKLVEKVYEEYSGNVGRLIGSIPYELQELLNHRIGHNANEFSNSKNLLAAIVANRRLSLKIIKNNTWLNIIAQYWGVRDKNLFIDFLLDTLPKDKLSLVLDDYSKLLLEANDEEIMKDLMRGGDYQSEVLKKIERSGRKDVMKMLRAQLLNKMGPNAGGLSLKDPGEKSGELALIEETEEKEPS
ncbi:TPA: hypothetical protein DCQ85_05275 [Candidatus Magasanikbacteria bacterium]|nr:hypothetical protein [Candidatus Magasanikbacteria bacterium]